MLEERPADKVPQIPDQPVQEPDSEELQLLERADVVNNLELVRLVDHPEHDQIKERLHAIKRHNGNHQKDPPRKPLHLLPN